MKWEAGRESSWRRCLIWVTVYKCTLVSSSAAGSLSSSLLSLSIELSSLLPWVFPKAHALLPSSTWAHLSRFNHAPPPRLSSWALPTPHCLFPAVCPFHSGLSFKSRLLIKIIFFPCSLLKQLSFQLADACCYTTILPGNPALNMCVSNGSVPLFSVADQSSRCAAGHGCLLSSASVLIFHWIAALASSELLCPQTWEHFIPPQKNWLAPRIHLLPCSHVLSLPWWPFLSAGLRPSGFSCITGMMAEVGRNGVWLGGQKAVHLV